MDESNFFSAPKILPDYASSLGMVSHGRVYRSFSSQNFPLQKLSVEHRNLLFSVTVLSLVLALQKIPELSSSQFVPDLGDPEFHFLKTI